MTPHETGGLQAAIGIATGILAGVGIGILTRTKSRKLSSLEDAASSAWTRRSAGRPSALEALQAARTGRFELELHGSRSAWPWFPIDSGNNLAKMTARSFRVAAAHGSIYDRSGFSEEVFAMGRQGTIRVLWRGRMGLVVALTADHGGHHGRDPVDHFKERIWWVKSWR